MVRTPDSLEAQLLRLPAADRARLAEVLLASLEDAEAAEEAEVEALWHQEAERRLAELETGIVTGIAAQEVFSDLARRFSAGRREP